MLLALARDGTEQQKEHATMGLGFLCFNHVANRALVVKTGGVEIVSRLSRDGSAQQKLAAAYALRNITVAPPTEAELARLAASMEDTGKSKPAIKKK